MSLLRTAYFALLAQIASAHFLLQYPYWRGDSFIPPASQYIYPCANVNQTESASNRTLWPLDGGSIVIDFHHPFTYVWMNLGLGSLTSAFNISLTEMPLNETGNGTICIPRFPMPADLPIEDGTDASLQVITVGDSGTALYNCADITFSSNATILSGDQCVNSTGVSISYLKQQINGSTATTASGSASTPSASASSTSGNSTSIASGIAHVNYASVLGGVISVILILGYGSGI